MELNDTTRTRAVNRLRDAALYLEQLDIPNMSNEIREDSLKICLLTRDIYNIRIITPLNEEEQTKLRDELRGVIQPRFNNYKNGTNSKGVVVQKPATLRFHYDIQLTAKVNDLCEQMKNGRGILCGGVSSNHNKTDVTCAWLNFIDPHELHMEKFILGFTDFLRLFNNYLNFKKKHRSCSDRF